ncbi:MULTISPECIES: helix-turn-helix transcriptional regulator [Streptomyces]|uniref:ArsR family transcriptional regulator n=1 Tax=Streptomyces auratus AGR0001 TaxID=1160718 RepID=J1S0R6_9ACTN|nr:ArsR family transcriptional regulator [Streptomyces auratus]QTZ91338.1 ArsR family transcriptional regulator [Streptomyces auratus AGR0001]
MKYASEDQEGPAAEQTAGPAASAPEHSERRAAGAGHPAAPHDEQQGTRNKVARSILDHGPSTAAELALRLELTQAAVRRHLDALAAEGVVEPREKRVYGTRGRGRPARAFALTDCGRDAFDQAYDQLATEALRWIAQSAGGGEKGEAAVAAFARARLAAQAEGYRKDVEAAEPEARTEALAKALTADGYAATARSAPNPQLGEQLCQHHCPVAHVAEQYPQLCEAETEVFSRLLGTHVQRLATIAHGDGVCTTFVPKAGAGKAAHRTPRTTKTTTASASTAGRNPA